MRYALALLGLAAIGWGAYGLVADDSPDIIGIGTFMVVALVAHDFVILPAAVAVSALVVRFAPGWARVPAQAALVVSAAVSVVALPLVLGKGRIFDNPSAFPQHYGRGLLLIVGLVWTVAVVWALTRWHRPVKRHAVKRHYASRPRVAR